MIRTAATALLLALCASAAHAQTAPQRGEIPVREVILSDGARRYAVTVKVGATDIVAGLDSGSSGLRILPGVLADGDAKASSHGDEYAYGSGAKFLGVVGEAEVSAGGLAGRTTVQLIKTIGCTDDKPRCPANVLPLEHYGIQGDGKADEGFKAIIGVNMAAADAASTLAGIGAKRWIIELPRPGESEPGRIVLNPTEAETQGYVELPILPQYARMRGGLHDAVNGCLINDRTQEKLCGAVDLDTGAPGIRVTTPGAPPKPWPAQTPATVALADRDGTVRVAESLTTGRREHASNLAFQQQARAPMTEVATGLAVYVAYSVLYDPAKGTVGFKARPPAPGGPTAVATK